MAVPQPWLLHVARVPRPLDRDELAAGDMFLQGERSFMRVVEAASDDEGRCLHPRVQPVWVRFVQRAEHLDDRVGIRPAVALLERAGEVLAHLRLAERRAEVLWGVLVADP